MEARPGISGPVRVSIVSPTFGGYGGLEAFVLTLAEGLGPDSGVDLVLAFKRVRSFRLAPELGAAAARLPGRVRFVGRMSAGLAGAIVRADVVHVQNPCPDVVMLSRILHRRVLVNVINHRLPGNSPRQRLWDLCLRLAHRRLYISEFVRRSWEGPRPLPGSEVAFPICRLATGERRPSERAGFVFAARWIANKGVDVLVDAYSMAGLDPVKWPLTLIGDGPLRPAVAGRVAELGLAGVSMPGFLPEDAKAEAIRSARFMVVPPNTGEDFGLTAIEARSLGVPCIVTRDGGVPEAAGAEAISCPPGDPAALAECLRTAAAMSADEYAGRARRTRESLEADLRRPGFYSNTYHRMAERSAARR